MKSPKQMDEKVEEYTYYMTLGLLILFVVIIFILILQFIVGLLTIISMGA